MNDLPRLDPGDPVQLARFVEAHWQRGACRLVHELSSPRAAFDVAAAYAGAHATEGVVRVWADDQFVNFPRDVMFLVRPEDATFAGWAERVRRAATSFAINLFQIQVHGGWRVWDRLERLLRPVFARTGLPYGGLEASLLCGSSHSVMPALQTWSRWEPAPHTGHLVYAASGAIRGTLDGRPLLLEEGELLYVDDAARLAAALDGAGCALIVNLRAGSARDRADRILRELVIAHAAGPQHLPHALHRTDDRAPDDVPPALRDTLDQLRAYATSEALAVELFAAWQSYETRLGFAGSPPPSRELELPPDARVAAHPGLRWSPHGGRLFVAAHGHVLRTADHPAVHALLEALTAGPARTAEELATELAADDGPSDEQIFGLLLAMFQRHAILVEQAGYSLDDG